MRRVRIRNGWNNGRGSRAIGNRGVKPLLQFGAMDDGLARQAFSYSRRSAPVRSAASRRRARSHQ